MPTRCTYCGGNFGLIRQRWLKNQFCSKRCRQKFLAKLMQDKDRVRQWLDVRLTGDLRNKFTELMLLDATSFDRGRRKVSHGQADCSWPAQGPDARCPVVAMSRSLQVRSRLAIGCVARTTHSPVTQYSASAIQCHF